MSTTNPQIESYFNQLLSELVIEIAFKAFQRSMAMTSTCPHCQKTCQNYSDKSGLDIYGNRVDGSDSSHVVECPCCKKSLAAVRFAPHLEKCMGMGRQSSRKRNIVKLSQEDESDNDLGFIMKDVLGGVSNETDPVSEASNSTKDEVFKKARVSPTKNTKSSSTNTTNASNTANTAINQSQSKAKPSTSTTTSKVTPSKTSSPSKASTTTTTNAVSVKKATSPNKKGKK